MRGLVKHLAMGAGMLLLTGGCANSTVQENATLIDYHRSGGIRGSDDHLVIHGDGTAILTRNGTDTAVAVAPDALDRLLDRLAEAGFTDLEDNYESSPGGADMYQYAITYQGHTVRAKDDSLPPALHPVIELLDRLLQGG